MNCEKSVIVLFYKHELMGILWKQTKRKFLIGLTNRMIFVVIYLKNSLKVNYMNHLNN